MRPVICLGGAHVLDRIGLCGFVLVAREGSSAVQSTEIGFDLVFDIVKRHVIVLVIAS